MSLMDPEHSQHWLAVCLQVVTHALHQLAAHVIRQPIALTNVQDSGRATTASGILVHERRRLGYTGCCTLCWT